MHLLSPHRKKTNTKPFSFTDEFSVRREAIHVKSIDLFDFVSQLVCRYPNRSSSIILILYYIDTNTVSVMWYIQFIFGPHQYNSVLLL